MPEIDELPSIASRNDLDRLPVWDESSGITGYYSIAQLLADYIKSGGNATLGTADVTTLTATTGSIATLSVTTSMSYQGGASVSHKLKTTAIVAVNTAAGFGGSTTIAVPGVVVGDIVSIHYLGAVPAAMNFIAWVDTDDEIRVDWYNGTAVTQTINPTFGFVVTRFL